MQVRFVPLAMLVAGLALIGAMSPADAGDPTPAAKKTFDRLIGAIKTGDRDAFVTDAADAFKKGTTQEIMDVLKKEVGARLDKGFKATYLCELNQAGHQVFLWKVAFTDKGDDIVTRIVVKDGKVAGLFLQ